MRQALSALLIALALVPLAALAVAQEPAVEVDSWVEKLREAVDTEAGLALTPDEAREMFDAIVALENTRVRTVTTDATDVYVISVDGRVLATVPLPAEHQHTPPDQP